MLNLLIVDDERHTRNYIMNTLPWQDLGIGIVKQAENGETALNLSLEFHPDIIVSDIRMPIMDGIEFAEKIREVLPDCKIIFISAYSDKKYLKSAITLKASNYVEKPIDLKELEAAIRLAVSDYVNSVNKANKEFLTNTRLLENLPALKADIANELCSKTENYTGLIKRLEYLCHEFMNNKNFITAVIRIKPNSRNEVISPSVFTTNVREMMEETFSNCKVISITNIRENDIIVTHLSKKDCDSMSALSAYIKQIANEMIFTLKKDYDIFIGLGKPVEDITEIYKSYQDAIISSQKIFFKGFNIVESYSENYDKEYAFDGNSILTFTKLLEENKIKECVQLINSLTQELKTKDNLLVNNVKKFYYNFFQKIVDVSSKSNINIEDGGSLVIWDKLLKIITIQEVELFIVEKLLLLDQLIYEKNAYSQVTHEIINKIKNNYTDRSLSVKSISDDLFMNKAYLCVVFKKDTGKTINQFIIEYRIEKSTELLKQRVKMLEIAEKVGFSDPNYYAKTFKKIKGITPSIYREKYTK